MIRGCIFDLDGVVVDTAKYHYLAWKRLAKEMGFDFTEQDNERLKGVSRMRSLDILLEIGGMTMGQEEKEAMATKKNEWYREYILKMEPGEILPGVQDFFSELKKEGMKIALGSASKNAVTILEQIGLKDTFDAIVDGTKVEKAKPDPEVFLKGAHEIGLMPEECVVFEDAEAGVEAAKSGKMKCVGVGDPEILGKADIVIPGFQDFHLIDLQQLNTAL
jgi:beta-phosphoglucomutase